MGSRHLHGGNYFVEAVGIKMYNQSKIKFLYYFLGGIDMKLVDKDAIFLRDNLDVLFIALNPPGQSNNNGHYFSGKQSTFFNQLYLSGLITEDLDKTIADDLVFGGTRYNYKNKHFGVIDLIPRLEETNSSKVKAKSEDALLMIERIREFKPKIVCIIHSKVMKQFKKVNGIELKIGYNGRVLEDLDTEFYCNYFPNGNNKTTDEKVRNYFELRNRL